MGAVSTASTIEHSLTLSILRGEHPAGSHLPTVRELATRHQVSAGTIQRAIAGLEARGLVMARQGSGIRVADPSSHGDLSLLPLRLEALFDQPKRAVALLAQFLEMRRMVVARLLTRHRAEVQAKATELSALAKVLARAKGRRARREADFAFSRAILQASGSILGVALLNSLAKTLDHLPEVEAAMYARPEQNATVMTAVLAALGRGDDDAAETIEEAMSALDALTVKRLHAALDRRKKALV